MTVEGKMLRRQSRHGETRSGIAKIGGKLFVFPSLAGQLLTGCGHFSRTQTKGRFDGIRETLTEIRSDDESIHDSFDPMGFVFFKADRLWSSQFDHLSIHTDPHKSLSAGLLDHVAKLPHLAGNEWRQNKKLGPHRPAKDGIRDLLRGLPCHALPRFGIMGHSGR